MIRKETKVTTVRPRLNEQEWALITQSRSNQVKGEVENVLVIGDLHEPFCLDGYLEFCKVQYLKYGCNRVIYIGDIIDNHYASFHTTDPDGLGGKTELSYCKEKIKKWYSAFPNAIVTLGNHDRIIIRKAFDSGVPKEWIKDIAEVLEVPNWSFVSDVTLNGVRYTHGDKTGKPSMSFKRDMISTVSGHYHTDFYLNYSRGIDKEIFGMAVGCGVDSSSYAMAYMQGSKKVALGCAVVLNNGTQPILISM